MEEPIEQDMTSSDVFIYQMPVEEPLPSEPNHKWLYIIIAAIVIIILGLIIVF